MEWPNMANNRTQFCVVPIKSVKLLAESVGISYLPSEAAAALAEDVTYRIRQTIQSAIQFGKHSKRDHLAGEDINRALFWSHVEPIYGYGTKNSNIFSSISTKDGDVFFHEDKEVNLRELTFSKGLSSLSELGDCESKISVEVSLLDGIKSCEESNNSFENTSKKHSNFDALSLNQKSYYCQLTKTIIKGDKNDVKVVLDGLKNSPKVQVFLPYLVNFITTGIKSFGNLKKHLRLFALVKTLVDNRNLYLEPHVVQFVRAVMHCLIEKSNCETSDLFDEWILRNGAAQTLCYIDRKCSNTTNFLHHQLLRTFKDIYEKNERPLHSHYGAIIGLSMFGLDAVEQTVLPHFKTYAQYLDTLAHTNARKTLIEISYVLTALKNAAVSLFRNKLRALAAIILKDDHADSLKLQASMTSSHSHEGEISHKSSYLDQTKWTKDVVEWYKDLYEFCGESFILLTGNLEDFKSIVQCRTRGPTKAFSIRHPNRHSTTSIHTQNLIQRALGARGERDFELDGTSSIPAKRRRLIDSGKTFKRSNVGSLESASFWKHSGRDIQNNESRFERMVEKSTLRRSKYGTWKRHVGKRRRHVSGHFLLRKRKQLPSLSVCL